MTDEERILAAKVELLIPDKKEQITLLVESAAREWKRLEAGGEPDFSLTRLYQDILDEFIEKGITNG